MFKTILSESILQMGTIFLSIIIEALPFVLLGCIVSGFLQSFLSASFVEKILPKNKFLAVFLGAFLGFFFPSCECGIVPIVHRFMEKNVPSYVAFSFMVTAPIINPIVIFSTYMAFGNTFRFALLRVAGAFLVAVVLGVFLAFLQKKEILTTSSSINRSISCCQAVENERAGRCELHQKHRHCEVPHTKNKRLQRINEASLHAVEEFFDTGRYLVFGSLLASSMQVFVPTKVLTNMTSSKPIAILVLLLLAFLLSLCSEADAFIGASLLSLFGMGPILAFLIFGPMVDVKNLLLMKRFFTLSFVCRFVGITSVVVFLFALLI